MTNAKLKSLGYSSGFGHATTCTPNAEDQANMECSHFLNQDCEFCVRECVTLTIRNHPDTEDLFDNPLFQEGLNEGINAGIGERFKPKNLVLISEPNTDDQNPVSRMGTRTIKTSGVEVMRSSFGVMLSPINSKNKVTKNLFIEINPKTARKMALAVLEMFPEE